ncbi:nitrogen assimilation transcription factor nirA [Niveomyces insectorum RCEF 264]|uniref:Nitrogen assimilation transcription factor nirA n=1 Tax=Niveomyces insectorum RCEF 264 TaxID=1081102 RepID=A0A162MTA4_9HYPO|nr:nitrogen assimilation transcription factor nirA [Niveomyces insectorum RCEF 264]
MSTPTTPKIIAKACNACRARKIRCDTGRPRCSTCAAQKRACVYVLEAPRKRPTLAQVEDLRSEVARLEALVAVLRTASPKERDACLQDTAPLARGQEAGAVTQSPPAGAVHANRRASETPATGRGSCAARDSSSQGSLPGRGLDGGGEGEDLAEDDLAEEPDLAPFVAVDEMGKPSSFGPSSALNQLPLGHPHHAGGEQVNDAVRNGLIANAALQRQQEPALAALPHIYGVPTDLALHLLDVHWSKEHHTFPLTYRPALIRDLTTHGPHCSEFLLYAIFARSSRLSDRLDVRDDPADPSTAGRRYFRRCDELLAEQGLLLSPSIPTVTALLLLGSTYNARGGTSRGWLFTGYALRMVFDLGLHLDPREGNHPPEEAEIRRRVFWSAFICDKLQSLYLGRPMTIHLRDAHVSHAFHDTFEEHELWRPQTGCGGGRGSGGGSGARGTVTGAPVLRRPTPIHSVSTFQQFCLLSRIMTQIINRFYVVGASSRNAKAALQEVDDALQSWKQRLPAELACSLPATTTPHTDTGLVATAAAATDQPYPPPNIMSLHAIFHSLVILLHRPFVSDGHLRQTTVPGASWQRCTAAARSITDIGLAYRAAHTLQAAPYILSYALYVACTIHVRNAAAEPRGRAREEQVVLLASSLQCLEELCRANPGVARPVSIIQRLMAIHGLDHTMEETADDAPSAVSLDLKAIYSTFPPNATTSDGGGGGGGWAFRGSNASSNLAPVRGNFVQPTRASEADYGNPARLERLDYFDFQDPLYGHMDGSLSLFFDLCDADFGLPNQG